MSENEKLKHASVLYNHWAHFRINIKLMYWPLSIFLNSLGNFLNNLNNFLINLYLGKLSKLKSGETWETVQSGDVPPQVLEQLQKSLGWIGFVDAKMRALNI